MSKKTQTPAEAVAALEKLTTKQLQARLKRLTGKPTRASKRETLIQKCTEALEAGAAPPKPTKAKVKRGARRRTLDVGTKFTRRYKAIDVEVLVTDDGYEWNGTTYPSLTALAEAVVGYRISGPHFFKILGK